MSETAVFSGSFRSTTPPGLPVLTEQKRQPRVQVSPRIITVAVPCPQHSKMFGQPASSQTVCRPRLRNRALIPWNSSCCGPAGSRTRSQSGLRAGRVIEVLLSS